MKPWVLFLTCLRALTRNPMRATLTVLGIVIGIAAVVAISEIGEGSKKLVADQVASLGAGKIMVWGASTRTAGVSSGKGGRASMRPGDAEAIMAENGDVINFATPVVRSSGQAIVDGVNWNPGSIVGGNEHYLTIDNWEVASGRNFDKDMVDKSARVCLIGQTIQRELFGDQDPIGKDIRVRDVLFTVIGTLKEKGAGHNGNDQDDVIIFPWTSVRMRLQGSPSVAQMSEVTAKANKGVSVRNTYSATGVNYYPGIDIQPYANAPHPLRTKTVDFVMFQAKDKESSTAAINAAAPILRRQHGLKPGQIDDFDVRDSAQFTNALTNMTEAISTLLLIVAMISLVVGGVGIMNIMMVSVTERTREIGLRMAVGARPRDIMAQFLLEAVLLCIVGGIIGIILGRAASVIVSAELGWVTSMSVDAIILSVSVSVFIGLVFGWYPAWKASRMDPIDALRHE